VPGAAERWEYRNSLRRRGLRLPALDPRRPVRQLPRHPEIPAVIPTALDRGLQDGAQASKLAPAQDGAEARPPDRPLSDVFVEVLSRSGLPPAIVEVDQADPLEAEPLHPCAKRHSHPPRAVEGVAPGMGVTGVETHTHAPVAVEEIEKMGELLPFAPELGAAAGAVLDQEIEVGRRAPQEGPQACGQPPEAAPLSLSSVMSGVEHNASAAEEGGSLQVIGDRADRAIPQRAVGGAEVDEVAGMNHEGSDAGSTKEGAELRNLRLWIPTSPPAARVAGEDLKAVALQGAGAARRPHQALCDRNVEAQAHPP